MTTGWWLTLLLVVPTFGMAAWMWWVVARFNLDSLSLCELPGMAREE